MKKGRDYLSAGFTIIEVMVVLTVSGLILLMAIVLVDGQTDKAEFISSIQKTQSLIQQSINNVIDGYYPYSNNFNCTVSGSGYPSINPGSGSMGGNQPCIFIGNILQFYPNPANYYSIYTAVGDRIQPGTDPPLQSEDLSDSDAVVITNLLPGDYTTQNLNYGLTVAYVCYSTHSTPTCSFYTGALAFTNLFRGFAISGVHPGVHSIDLFALPGATFGVKTLTWLEELAPATQGNATKATSAQICFNSGTTNQSGLLTINSSNRNFNSNITEPLVTSLVIFNNLDCS